MSQNQKDLNKLLRDYIIPVHTAVHIDQTIEEAILFLRQKHIEDEIIYIYVVDDEQKLIGVVPTRDLLLSDPGVAISSVMDTSLITLRGDEIWVREIMKYGKFELGKKENSKRLLCYSGHSICCLDLEGNEIWQKQLNGWVTIGHDQKRVVYSSFGSIHCLNWEGEKIWEHKIEGAIGAIAITEKGEALCASQQNSYSDHSQRYLYSFDPKGKETWKRKIDKDVAEIIFNSNESLILRVCYEENGCFCGKCTFLCIDAKGNELWRYNNPSEFYIHMVKEGKIFCNPDHSLTCINLHNGKELWHYPLENCACELTLDPESGNVICTGELGIHCVDSNGNRVWTYHTKESMMQNTIFDTKNRCVFSESPLCWHCLNEKGEPIWKRRIKGLLLETTFDSENEKIIYEIESSDYSLDTYNAKGERIDRCEIKGIDEPSPIFDPNGERIFFKSPSCNLHCLKPNGEELWKFDDGPIMEIIPDSNRNRILCFSYPSHVYCLDQAGEKMWTYPTKSIFLDAKLNPLNGEVFSLSKEYLHRISSEGKEIWKIKNEENAYKILCNFQGERIFLVSDPTLSCADLSGEKIWEYSLRDNYLSDIAFDPHSGKIFCLIEDDSLYCLDAKGKELWSQKAEGIVCSLETERIFCHFGNKLFCLDFEGTEIWQKEFSSSIRKPKVDLEMGRIFFYSWSAFYCLDFEGAEIWKRETQSYIDAFEWDLKNKRIFLDFGDKLCCLDFDQNELWSCEKEKYKELQNAIYDPKSGITFCLYEE